MAERTTPDGVVLLIECVFDVVRDFPATSIDALLAWSASHCLFRLTRSGRFLLRRIAHRAIASFAPLDDARDDTIEQLSRSIVSNEKRRTKERNGCNKAVNSWRKTLIRI